MTRQHAQRLGLINAEKPDSQDICFVPGGDYTKVVKRLRPEAGKPGDITHIDGRILGRHEGVIGYTIGQRKGIGLPSNTDHEFFVVVKKAFATNTLHVAFDHPEVADLYTHHATAAHFSWINRAPAGTGDFLARVRYRDPATPVRFQPRDDGSGQVGLDFPQTQRGLASGQIVAIYDGPVLLGGGEFV